MTATTIRVRVNPSGSGEYVIYADAEDQPMPWLGQDAGGRYTGWCHKRDVIDWPEYELTVPELAHEDSP